MLPLLAQHLHWLEAVPIIVRVMRMVSVIVVAVLVLLLGLLVCFGPALLLLLLLLVLLILVAGVLLLSALELSRPCHARELSGGIIKYTAA